MKILKKQISTKDGSGVVVLRPETSEDLWSCYNLLQQGDLVRTTTFRKVMKESSTGSTSSTKRRLSLTIQLQKIDFDPQGLELRVSGITTSESTFVRLGSHHTLTLELRQNFSLEKTCWDQIYLDILEDACHPENASEVAAVVMQQSGLAHLCLITGSLTITKARIDVTIPKKRSDYTSQHVKAVEKFYEAVYQALLNHVPWDKIKIVLLGSPGFVKDDFYSYLKREAVRRDDKVLLRAIKESKFLLVKASSGHKHALEEVLSDSTITSQMEETKVVKEVQTLQKFMRMIDTDPLKAYYGYRHVKMADEQMAVESLLITDELFRCADVGGRKKYVALVESVRSHGGNVYVFSTMHVSGQQLQQVSGVAAILRYPLPDLEELEEDVAALEENDDPWPREDGESSADDDEAQKQQYNDGEARVREDMHDMGLG